MLRANCCALLSLILLALTRECSCYGQLVYRTGWFKREDVPDTAKRSVHFIEQYADGAEIHEVITEDGYVLSMHRVLSDREEADLRKPAVIIQHGIIASSVIWLLSQEKSLPFVLSRSGFDVWLLDTRGNSYSRKHLFLSTNDPRYWDFSFHEQAVFDLPAATDYVLNATGNEKLFYVGHSRGTTMALALLSSRPEYNEKFYLVSLLAPIAYVRHVGVPLFRLLFKGSISSQIETVIKSLRAYVVPGSSEASIQFREIICNRTQLACIDIIFIGSGFDYELLNKTMIPVYLSHYPEGAALKEGIHYLQIGHSDEFRQFDHGPRGNVERYGRPSPPSYDLSKITAPLSTHYGDNDLLVRPKDLNRLLGRLSSVVAHVRVPFPKFTHTDFLWATRADDLLYKPLTELMMRFVPWWQ